MVADLIGGKGEGKLRTETSGLAGLGYYFLGYYFLSIDGDIICGTRFLLPVQKLEKRRVVSMSELGIIYFYAIHNGLLSRKKKLDSLSKLYLL